MEMRPAFLPLAMIVLMALPLFLLWPHALESWPSLAAPLVRFGKPPPAGMKPTTLWAPGKESGPLSSIYEAAVLERAKNWDDTPVPITKPAAITAVINRITKEELRFFASLALFMPDAETYVACTTPLINDFVNATWPKPRKLRFVPALDEFAGINKKEMRDNDFWHSFNKKRVDILRFALLEGHDGAWYMDTDSFLLAPLPRIDSPVGLSYQPIRKKIVKTFGRWNSGMVFFRSFPALRTWDIAHKKLQHTNYPFIQVTLMEVARKHLEEVQRLPCGLNIGWFHFTQDSAVGRYDDVRCHNGQVQYRNCTFVSGHWHVKEENAYEKSKFSVAALFPIMYKALRDCNNPFLPYYENPSK